MAVIGVLNQPSVSSAGREDARTWDVKVAPAAAVLSAIADQSPQNPFYSAAYCHARVLLGETPCVFTVPRVDGGTISFYGFMRRTRFGRNLEIPSLPAIARPITFLEVLREFSASNGVTRLQLNTYASPPLSVPPFAGETERFKRTEFVIDLTGAPLLGTMSRDHRQRIKRAERAGLKLRRTVDEAACMQHAALISSSMVRREQRGEAVSTRVAVEPLAALLRAGAGELFQVLDGERVVSSMLLLRSTLGAYDHTSGSTAEGMATGASRLVIFLACAELQREGCQVLNLGGVRDHETGLRTFKEHFGARQIQLEAISAEFTTPMMRLARRAARFVRGY